MRAIHSKNQLEISIVPNCFSIMRGGLFRARIIKITLVPKSFPMVLRCLFGANKKCITSDK